MNLKLEYFSSEKNDVLIQSINDGLAHKVKISTNKYNPEFDRFDNRLVNRLNGIKVIYKLQDKGCLIMNGNLFIDFRQPFGGMFYCKQIYIDVNTEFDLVNGVNSEICFSSYPAGVEETRTFINMLVNSPNFVYNISQFNEFMDIFTFYKQLSSELNNNTAYFIKRISNPYYFVSVDIKDVEVDETNPITNSNGIVLGYRIESYKYRMLTSDIQQEIKKIIDVTLEVDELDKVDIVIKKIVKFFDNLYLTEREDIDDSMIRSLVKYDLVNIQKDGKEIIISGEPNKWINNEYKYLNLFDVGQKVKLESIENSLRLINQGAAGSACEMLEYIIGNKPMPSKLSHIKTTKERTKYIEQLDESQKAAFLMATDGSPVSLIKGPPGTGKTYVINAIVQYITKELKQKVIISSQTHVAIDNVLDELMENYDLIIPNRITNRRNRYAGDEIDSTLYMTWAKKFENHNLRASNKELANAIMQDMKNFKGQQIFRFSQETQLQDYYVIGATTTTSAIGGKKGLELLEEYDWLIIDEVSKCPITEVLRYLPYVNHIIMVGDDFQLAPLLEFTKDDVKNLPAFNEEKFEKLESIYQKSVFASTYEKAKKANRMIELNVNYRSVRSVLNAYNIFYDNRLKNMREIVKPHKVQFNNKEKYDDKDIFFVNVKNGKEYREGTSRYNVEELEATAEILQDLLKTVVDSINVTISAIFPYAAQIDKFQKRYRDLINKAKKHFKNFEIDTVDAFQGKETDIVLVNTVVTTEVGNFLNEFRRINVSMSRARDKLFIFGNPITLSKIEMKTSDGNKRKFFKDIIDDITRFGKVIEYNGGLNYGTNKTKIKVI